MPEITDQQLAEIRAKLTACSPLVQSLVARLDRVEGQLEENTALRERVKRMETVLKKLAESYKPGNMSIISLMGKIAYDALKEGI